LNTMDELEKRLQTATAEREIAGAVISATDKAGMTGRTNSHSTSSREKLTPAAGKFHYTKAFGSHSAEPDSKPLDLETTFWLLSATKLMTAVAALQCVDRGLISLDDDVTRVLPEWKDPDLLEGFETGSGKPMLRNAQNMITLRYP